MPKKGVSMKVTTHIAFIFLLSIAGGNVLGMDGDKEKTSQKTDASSSLPPFTHHPALPLVPMRPTKYIVENGQVYLVWPCQLDLQRAQFAHLMANSSSQATPSTTEIPNKPTESKTETNEKSK